MKITIAEPVLTNPLEQFKPAVATSTRKLLAEMFPADNTATEDIQPLTKEVLKEMKQLVYTGCDNKMAVRYSKHTSPEEHMLRAVGVAATVANFENNREGSYCVEFAFQWLRGYLFKNNLPMPTDFPANTLGALCYPSCTCGYMDSYLSGMGVAVSQLLPNLADAVPPVLLSMYDTPAHVQYYHGKSMYEGRATQTEVFSRDNYRGVVYTESGTAWFAGFLNNDDVLKLRFRRMRLGAAMKELSGDDAIARRAADIRDLNDFDLVLHPNDRPFGAEYVRMYADGNDLGSCMTSIASKYYAPFDVHPCDVYSCAHYGQGDNGLVLVEVQQCGTPVGRGILNVQTKQIVRWYGEYKAEVMLRNSFSIHTDSDALDDVQLALIQDDSKIAAPYLDGCQSCGIEDGELYVRSHGAIDMDDTSGYQRCGASEYDVCSERYFQEDELEYQPFHETYYHPDYTHEGIRCLITGEYCSHHNTSWAIVDGEEVRISDVIWYNASTAPEGWVRLNDTIGWTNDVDQYHYDEETEEYYTDADYEELLEERVKNEVDDEAA